MVSDSAESLELVEINIPDPVAQRSVWRIRNKLVSPQVDQVIEEIPVALVFNGISHAVMLASPANLEDFALGFSLSERILETPNELYDLELVPSCEGISIEMEIATKRFGQLKALRRSQAGRTGCGLCGVESLTAVNRMPQHPTLEGITPLTLGLIDQALGQLNQAQPLRDKTGAVHAAAWFNAKGELYCVREDVGRHNALDKLIGALATAERPEGFALVTSRASYEMVQKSVVAGFPVLIAMSAPTGLAIRQADSAGLTLIGFARPSQLVIYSHPERVALNV
jgi:FdhD protein